MTYINEDSSCRLTKPTLTLTFPYLDIVGGEEQEKTTQQGYELSGSSKASYGEGPLNFVFWYLEFPSPLLKNIHIFNWE